MVQTQLPDPAKVLIMTRRDTGLLTHAVVEIEVALLHRAPTSSAIKQPQLVLAVQLPSLSSSGTSARIGVPIGSRVLSAATAAIGNSGNAGSPTTSLVGRRSKKT